MIDSASEFMRELEEANKAFREVTRAVDACLGHAKACRVCRSRIASIFLECHTRTKLAFEYLVAKVDAEPHFIMLKKLRLEVELVGNPDAKVPEDWLEKLYRLNDFKG